MHDFDTPLPALPHSSMVAGMMAGMWQGAAWPSDEMVLLARRGLVAA